ncbi:nitrite reductase small subunit NirD [Pseudomonas leptonychotis]|jgi:nitrite reductase (NADH) small subunit|uniref:nitrite reductase small subunit NirD n=1 Tax=Pseudomonas leptonychotis TaxID=2448482 RepID=UPI0039EEE2A9
MSQLSAERSVQHALQWQAVCARQDLVANSGVVAWIEGGQVALFYLPDEASDQQLFALDNRDPLSGANVIGRGIVGSLAGDLVIAAPLYKQHFRLQDGTCLEYPQQQLRTWPVRLQGDTVEIALS